MVQYPVSVPTHTSELQKLQTRVGMLRHRLNVIQRGAGDLRIAVRAFEGLDRSMLGLVNILDFSLPSDSRPVTALFYQTLVQTYKELLEALEAEVAKLEQEQQ